MKLRFVECSEAERLCGHENLAEIWFVVILVYAELDSEELLLRHDVIVGDGVIVSSP